jgi:hypothetical protein
MMSAPEVGRVGSTELAVDPCRVDGNVQIGADFVNHRFHGCTSPLLIRSHGVHARPLDRRLP